MTAFRSIEWTSEGTLRLLDQRQLPVTVEYIDCSRLDDVADAIVEMAVRGAPAIGVAAAFGLVIAARNSQATDVVGMVEELRIGDAKLRGTRPTAVNLGWALDEMKQIWTAPLSDDGTELAQNLEATARRLMSEDVAVNREISRHGAALLRPEALVIHHCNTGSLATVDQGTALGVIRHAHESGAGIRVLVDETRPRLQGARLTAWELQQMGVPYRLIVDGASGHFMRTESVDACLVGCDRVAANGDVANKIGTYNLAVVARSHGVPFYVAAPLSSIDLTIANGDEIPIEERDPTEVSRVDDSQLAPDGVTVANPAFDVTPAELVTAIITELGVVRPPYSEGLARQIARGPGPPTFESHRAMANRENHK